MSAGAAAAWLGSPAHALLQAAGRLAVPALIDQLIARMTIEEKAGQLQLMASAWGGGAALTLNPPGSGSDFESQVNEARQGQLTGVFNGNGAKMARIMQTAAVRESRMKIPLIFAADIIHGHRTIFPVPLAEVASFEPDLNGIIDTQPYQVISRDATSVAIRTRSGVSNQEAPVRIRFVGNDTYWIDLERLSECFRRVN